MLAGRAGALLDGMSGGFGFPFGCVAAVVAVVLADVAGATRNPWYALVTLGLVVLLTGFWSSVTAAIGVAWWRGHWTRGSSWAGSGSWLSTPPRPGPRSSWRRFSRRGGVLTARRPDTGADPGPPPPGARGRAPARPRPRDVKST